MNSATASDQTKVVLGVDGGQTSTTAAVCDLTGKLLGLGRAGPANHVWEPGGAARARRAVTRSTTQALRAAALPRDYTAEAAFLGMTGAKADGRTDRRADAVGGGVFFGGAGAQRPPCPENTYSSRSTASNHTRPSRA